MCRRDLGKTNGLGHLLPGHISGTPGLTRTADTRFRKPLLYPLSYRGIDFRQPHGLLVTPADCLRLILTAVEGPVKPGSHSVVRSSRARRSWFSWEVKMAGDERFHKPCVETGGATGGVPAGVSSITVASALQG